MSQRVSALHCGVVLLCGALHRVLVLVWGACAVRCVVWARSVWNVWCAWNVWWVGLVRCVGRVLKV